MSYYSHYHQWSFPMSDTFTYGTTDRKLATFLFKKGWRDYSWQDAGHTKAAMFKIPIVQSKRFRLHIEQFYEKR